MLWHHELDCTHSQRPEQWLQWSLRHPSIVWHLKTIVWHLLILEKNKHQNLLGLSVPFIWLRHNWIDGDLMRAILMADALSMFWGCSHVIGCMGWIVWIGVRGSGQGRMCDKMCMGPEQVREPGRERERAPLIPLSLSCFSCWGASAFSSPRQQVSVTTSTCHSQVSHYLFIH